MVARSARGRRFKAGAVEFDEFADHALLTQHLDDFQHEVRACRAFHHLTGQAEADDFGDQHGDRLAQHRGLSLNPTNAPAKNGKAVDHGRVAVCANECVGIGDFLAF